MSIRWFDHAFLDELSGQAEGSPRLRQHTNLHGSYAEPCQRLFNAIGVGSYIRPHRHRADPKTETLLAVRGRLTLVLFDGAGHVFDAVRFGPMADVDGGVFAIELPPGSWHTVLAETPGSVLFEVKAGPFDSSLAKELAPWAPEEGSPAVPAYLAQVRRDVANLLAGFERT